MVAEVLSCIQIGITGGTRMRDASQAGVLFRHLVIPVLFHTIYACGLRASEARPLSPRRRRHRDGRPPSPQRQRRQGPGKCSMSEPLRGHDGRLPHPRSTGGSWRWWRSPPGTLLSPTFPRFNARLWYPPAAIAVTLLQPHRDTGLPTAVVAPGDDGAVLFQRQTVVPAGGDRGHPTQPRRDTDIRVFVSVFAPGDDGAVLLQRQTVVPSRRRSRSPRSAPPGHCPARSRWRPRRRRCRPASTPDCG